MIRITCGNPGTKSMAMDARRPRSRLLIFAIYSSAIEAGIRNERFFCWRRRGGLVFFSHEHWVQHLHRFLLGRFHVERLLQAVSVFLVLAAHANRAERVSTVRASELAQAQITGSDSTGAQNNSRTSCSCRCLSRSSLPAFAQPTAARRAVGESVLGYWVTPCGTR